MKIINLFIYFGILMSILFTSCEEVITLDLENDAPKIVIEAVVNATDQTASVLITKSNGFYESATLEVINDAMITLTQADGTTIDFQFVGNGRYTASNIAAAVGDELSILVVDGAGEEYRAVTQTPHPVTLDSVTIEEATGGPGVNPFGDETLYRLFSYWQDVADVENYYRIRAIKNDTLQADVYTLIDDIGNDGQQLFRPFFDTFIAGDVVTLQLLSLDKSTYIYFSDLSEIQGQGFGSTTPYNPHSNFDNNALGYFGIIRMDTQVLTIQ